MFLFVEVACLGHGAAACRRLRGCLWEDVAFWKAYAGVCLARQPVRDGPAKLRERFRVWLFHLEGHWAMDFANAAAQDRQAEFGANFLQLFSDARYIASGLMPWDKGPEVDAFAQVACSLLSQPGSSSWRKAQLHQLQQIRPDRKGLRAKQSLQGSVGFRAKQAQWAFGQGSVGFRAKQSLQGSVDLRIMGSQRARHQCRSKVPISHAQMDQYQENYNTTKDYLQYYYSRIPMILGSSLKMRAIGPNPTGILGAHGKVMIINLSIRINPTMTPGVRSVETAMPLGRCPTC
ncbi:unnamed protein product [Effrenium voratum]|nr:unnamed protein product [Effrenium voratum]